MMTLQEISDRLELEKLTHDYSHAIDTRDFDLLNDVFTPDAFIDYSAFGAPAGDFPYVRDWLKTGMNAFGGSHHMVTNHRFVIEGDHATGRVMCFNPMESLDESGTRPVMVFGLFYIDEYVRTPAGWRIKSRVEEATYTQNVPKGVLPD